MFKHILKIIWKQRRANGWLFAELLIVIGAVWFMMETAFVDNRTYYSPLGYDITNVWRFKLSDLSEKSPAYVPDSLYTSSEAEDLRRLMEQIRQHPAVENVCVTFYSCPYSYGNSWTSVVPLDGDTAKLKQQSYQVRRVSPEYFELFGVTDANGHSISADLQGHHNPIIISADMEKLFYEGERAKGRQLQILDVSEQAQTIAAVCQPVRESEYVRSEPCFFHVLEGSSFNNVVGSFGASSAELCVKMKQEMSKDQMNKVLAEMDERLTVNNLNVYGVRSIADFRADRLKDKDDESSRTMALMVFLLLNVLFGIVGTFWLRTQGRQGEIGLRVALGSSRAALKRFMYMEGLCLLLLTVPFLLLFASNMIYMDRLDSYRVPLSVGRFLITFGGTYLLMAGMILLGIWFPVRKAIRMKPAEALHYE